jgi:hypothetical protein
MQHQQLMVRLGVLVAIALTFSLWTPAALTPRADAFNAPSGLRQAPARGGVPILPAQSRPPGRPLVGGFAAARDPAAGNTAAIMMVATVVGWMWVATRWGQRPA